MLIFLTVFSGCNFGPAKPEGFPEQLYPCQLTILQSEVPLQEAAVQLIPNIETGKIWSIGGRTNENGIVAIHTHGKWNGTPPGSYKVVVFKKYREFVKNKDVYYSLVDENFATSQTTPLELEIKEVTSQTFDVGPAVKKKISK
jgi:hypothetical protein